MSKQCVANEGVREILLTSYSQSTKTVLIHLGHCQQQWFVQTAYPRHENVHILLWSQQQISHAMGLCTTDSETEKNKYI